MRRNGWVLAVAAGLTLAGCAGSEGAQVSTAGEAPAGTEAPSASTTTVPSGVLTATAIGDESGDVRGWLSAAEEGKRRNTIRDRILAKRDLWDDSLPPEVRKARMDALSVIYALEVRNDEGELVGYFTTEFVEVDEYPALLRAAESLIAEAEEGS